jgi:nucleoid-associated protein YgaU
MTDGKLLKGNEMKKIRKMVVFISLFLIGAGVGTAQEAEIAKAKRKNENARSLIKTGRYDDAEERAIDAWKNSEQAKALEAIKKARQSASAKINQAARLKKQAESLKATIHAKKELEAASASLKKAQNSFDAIPPKRKKALAEADSQISQKFNAYVTAKREMERKIEKKDDELEEDLASLKKQTHTAKKDRDAAIEKNKAPDNIRKQTKLYNKIRDKNVEKARKLEADYEAFVREEKKELGSKREKLDELIIDKNVALKKTFVDMYQEIGPTAQQATAKAQEAVRVAKAKLEEIRKAKAAANRALAGAKSSFEAVKRRGLEKELQKEADDISGLIRQADSTMKNANPDATDDYVKVKKLAEDASSKTKALDQKLTKLKQKKAELAKLKKETDNSLKAAERKIESLRKAGVEKELPDDFKKLADLLKSAKDDVKNEKYTDAQKKSDKIISDADKLLQKLKELREERRKKLLLANKRKAAEKAIKSAETVLGQAKEAKADVMVPDLYENAHNILAKAKKELADKEYDPAIKDAEAAEKLAKEALEKANKVKPAFYRVRLIPERRDCLWRIAEYPFIYDNPLKWRVIFRANRAKIKDPHWIYPGQLFSIPSIDEEKREGEWVPPEKEKEKEEEKKPEPDENLEESDDGDGNAKTVN